jgi:FdrA protein
VDQTKDGEERRTPMALLSAAPRIINVGLESFAQSLANEGARVVHVRWSPPAGGNARLASLLTKLRS